MKLVLVCTRPAGSACSGSPRIEVPGKGKTREATDSAVTRLKICQNWILQQCQVYILSGQIDINEKLGNMSDDVNDRGI